MTGIALAREPAEQSPSPWSAGQLLLRAVQAVFPFPYSQDDSIRILRRWCARLRHRIEGLEHLPAHGPAILLTNHTGWEEVLIMLVTIPRPFGVIGLRELFHLDEDESWRRLFESQHFSEIGPAQRMGFVTAGRLLGPCVRAQFEKFGAFPVRIHNPRFPHRFDANGMRDAVATLAAGRVLLLYPEAGLDRRGVMLPFKPGIGLLLRLLARRGIEVPIVVGAQHSAGSISPTLRGRQVARFTFAPPVVLRPSRSDGAEWDREAARVLQRRVEALLPRVWPGEPPPQTWHRAEASDGG